MGIRYRARGSHAPDGSADDRREDVNARLPTAATRESSDPLGLNADDVRRFHEQGYLGPLLAFKDHEIQTIRGEVESVLTSSGLEYDDSKPDTDSHWRNRHLDQAVVYRMATAPAILDAELNWSRSPSLAHLFLRIG